MLFYQTWSLVHRVTNRAQDDLSTIIRSVLMRPDDAATRHDITKTLGLDPYVSGDIHEYVLCPSCHSLYGRCRNVKCGRVWSYGTAALCDPNNKCERVRELPEARTPVLCTHIAYKNSQFKQKAGLGGPCGTPLLQPSAFNDESARARPTRGDLASPTMEKEKKALCEERRDAVMRYSYRPLIQRLAQLLARPGFESMLEEWRGRAGDTPATIVTDVYGGRIWRRFQSVNGTPFLSAPHNLAFALNVDWFQPFEHVQYSVGVLFLTLLNLPKDERVKRENIIILGLIPGGSERNADVSLNHFLQPLVDELKQLHPTNGTGVRIRTHDHPAGVNVRAALLMVACDLPAGKKVSGFAMHGANKGCSRCDKDWGEAKKAPTVMRPVGDDDSHDDGGDEPEVVDAAIDEETKAGQAEAKRAGGDGEGKGSAVAPAIPPAPAAPDAPSRLMLRRGYKDARKLAPRRTNVKHRIDAKRWKSANGPTARAAVQKDTGVKWSQLLDLDYFDPVRMTVIDPMHSFWLGVCRTTLKWLRDKFWPNTTAHGKRVLDDMQSLLDAMIVPAGTVRVIRKWGANMSQLNAGQLRFVMNSASIPLFEDHLSWNSARWSAWLALVEASRILSQPFLTVGPEHIPAAGAAPAAPAAPAAVPPPPSARSKPTVRERNAGIGLDMDDDDSSDEESEPPSRPPVAPAAPGPAAASGGDNDDPEYVVDGPGSADEKGNNGVDGIKDDIVRVRSHPWCPPSLSGHPPPLLCGAYLVCPVSFTTWCVSSLGGGRRIQLAGHTQTYIC